MDFLYLHLLLNHIPVIGTVGALVLLGAAFVSRSRDLAVAGLVAVVIVALATIPVYLTGEPAEERVEHLAGFDHDAIHEHEDAADYAIFFMEVSGAVALIPLAMSRRRPVSRTWIAITMLITLFSFSVIARTAYLGGKIRHTEVGSAPSSYEDD